jgi:hypothetical protein
VEPGDGAPPAGAGESNANVAAWDMSQGVIKLVISMELSFRY